jgi:uncharacterized membrane protein YkvA (DUF1232 family)
MRIFRLLRLELLPVLMRLPAYSRLAADLVREPALLKRHKLILLGGIAYLLSPVDLIPGFIPVLGQLDDLAIALWTLRATLRAAPPEVADRHLVAQGLTWSTLDDDLRRVGQSGRLLARAGLTVGRMVLGGAARSLIQLGQRLIQRRLSA